MLSSCFSFTKFGPLALRLALHATAHTCTQTHTHTHTFPPLVFFSRVPLPCDVVASGGFESVVAARRVPVFELDHVEVRPLLGLGSRRRDEHCLARVNLGEATGACLR